MSYSSLSAEELVRACSESGNAEAWGEFLRRFGPVINAAVRRIVLGHGNYDPDLIKDLAQDTLFKLCADDFRVLRNFKPKHENAFYGMMKVMAARVALDYYRKRPLPVDDFDFSEREEFIPDPNPSGFDHLEFRSLCQQVDKMLCAHCSARDREIFWLYFSEMGLTAAEIARISRFSLDESGVESVLHRLKCLVRRKIAERGKNGDQGPDKAA